jgi:transposase-like protein
VFILKCPKCGSEDVKKKTYAGSTFLVCKSCKYDESEEVDIVPEYDKSQKEKARYSPYRSRVK